MFLFVIPLVFTLLNGASADQCSDRKVHLTKGGKEYHFSWKEHPDKAFSWSQGRKYCKDICMDLVSLETKDDWNTILEIFAKEKLEYTWTSGRKCNFAGCDKPSLQPVIEKGWFWASSKKKIPNPFSGSCQHCEWGPTGALGKRQRTTDKESRIISMRAAWPSSTTCTTTGSSGTTWPATTKSRLSVESSEIFWGFILLF
jgi:hypothetical protein